MAGLLWLNLVYWIFAFDAKGDEIENQFISDVISTFGFTSPIILYHGDAPEICFTRQWVLCLNYEDEQDIEETGELVFTRKSLHMIYQSNKSLRKSFHFIFPLH